MIFFMNAKAGRVFGVGKELVGGLVPLIQLPRCPSNVRDKTQANKRFNFSF